MRRFFTEQTQKKALTEMAAPKMPGGTKRKRSKDYAHTHDIHIGGEHVATISGHQANRFMDGRGIPAHVKVYQIYHNEQGMLKGEPHKDHSYDSTESRPTWVDDKKNPHGGKWDYDKRHDVQVQVARQYGSMEDAIHAVHATHQNKQEFGANHDPRDRWKHAIKLATGHDEHEQKAKAYKSALGHISQLGHSDVTDALQHHADAHAAKATKPSQDKLKQWTRDAHEYTSHTHEYAKFDGNTKTHEARDVPNHPDHHALAVQARNVHQYGHPEGSEWDRTRKAREAGHGDGTPKYM